VVGVGGLGRGVVGVRKDIKVRCCVLWKGRGVVGRV